MKTVNITDAKTEEKQSPIIYILACLLVLAGAAGFGYYELNKNKIRKAN